MIITAQVKVPDGEYCSGCDLYWRSENKVCHCLLFGFIELTEKYRANMVSGTDIVKCDECKAAGGVED